MKKVVKKVTAKKAAKKRVSVEVPKEESPCGRCDGRGLLNAHTLCDACEGTGK